ncbi:MAG: DUF4339 domain-containing protein [Bradyrhizobium sp.]|nr:DUF4339 domain-containing protein [Bradyrhizobium sp.]
MSWWYVLDGERRGPVNEDELSRLLSNGALTADSLLWKSGMQGWEPAANIADLNPGAANKNGGLRGACRRAHVHAL